MRSRPRRRQPRIHRAYGPVTLGHGAISHCGRVLSSCAHCRTVELCPLPAMPADQAVRLFSVGWARRKMAAIESIRAFEGTETIQTLIVGRDITGVSSFS